MLPHSGFTPGSHVGNAKPACHWGVLGDSLARVTLALCCLFTLAELGVTPLALVTGQAGRSWWLCTDRGIEISVMASAFGCSEKLLTFFPHVNVLGCWEVNARAKQLQITVPSSLFALAACLQCPQDATPSTPSAIPTPARMVAPAQWAGEPSPASAPWALGARTAGMVSVS